MLNTFEVPIHTCDGPTVPVVVVVLLLYHNSLKFDELLFLLKPHNHKLQVALSPTVAADLAKF